MNNLKNLIWWMYQPSDEREQQLYLQAYKRCSYVFMYYIILICGMFCIDYLLSNHTPMAESINLVLGLIALVFGLV